MHPNISQVSLSACLGFSASRDVHWLTSSRGMLVESYNVRQRHRPSFEDTQNEHKLPPEFREEPTPWAQCLAFKRRRTVEKMHAHQMQKPTGGTSRCQPLRERRPLGSTSLRYNRPRLARSRAMWQHLWDSLSSAPTHPRPCSKWITTSHTLQMRASGWSFNGTFCSPCIAAALPGKSAPTTHL